MTVLAIKPSGVRAEHCRVLGETLHNEYLQHPGGDLLPAVQALGGCVQVNAPMPGTPADPAGIRVWRTAFRIDLLQSRLPLQRWSTAVLLGHYKLHCEFRRHLLAGPDDLFHLVIGEIDERPWMEANWFAAGMLMPDDYFVWALQHFGCGLGRVAEPLILPIDMVRARARELEVI